MTEASGSGNLPPSAKVAVAQASSRNMRNILRIQKELERLSQDPVPFIYIHADESNLTELTGLVVGPLETPYAGGFFTFHIRTGSNYPLSPPDVRCLTSTREHAPAVPYFFHNGSICLSILKSSQGREGWSPAETLSSLLLSIHSLMYRAPSSNNDPIKYHTVRGAVLGTLKDWSTSRIFREVLERLYLLWYDMYVATAMASQFNTKSLIMSLEDQKKTILSRMESIDCATDSETDNTSEKTDSNIEGARRMLSEEYLNLSQRPPDSGSAAPREMANPFLWDATVFGPTESPWENGLFSLELRFSRLHPYCPPFARFTSEMYHPNITRDGFPALDLIQTRWNPDTSVRQILNGLQALLATNDPIYPVNREAALLYRFEKDDYDRKVRRLVHRGGLQLVQDDRRVDIQEGSGKRRKKDSEFGLEGIDVRRSKRLRSKDKKYSN